MAEQDAARDAVEVPYNELAPETLRRLLVDLVTRDGTDYGAVEWTLEQKLTALQRQLERGAAKLTYDPESKSVGLITTEALDAALGHDD